MKKIKVILFVFSLLMFMPSIVKAQCTYDEKSGLQALAGNLNFSYNYVESDQGVNSSVGFNIIISNIRPELYIVDQTNIKVYNYNAGDIVINNNKPGTTTQFIVYGNTDNCYGVELMTNYVTLPAYNSFYKDKICEGVTNLKLCNRWSKVELSYEEFVKKVEEHKAQFEIEKVPVTIEETGVIEKLIEFLSKYSIYLFGGIIIVCSGLIFYLKRKDDFDLN